MFITENAFYLKHGLPRHNATSSQSITMTTMPVKQNSCKPMHKQTNG